MINVPVYQNVVFCLGSACAIRHDIHIARHLMSEVQHGSLVGTQVYHEVLSTRFLVLVSVVVSGQNSCLHGVLIISSAICTGLQPAASHSACIVAEVIRDAVIMCHWHWCNTKLQSQRLHGSRCRQ